jgi:hypothetical protein
VRERETRTKFRWRSQSCGENHDEHCCGLGSGGPELDGGGRAICAPDARLPNSSRGSIGAEQHAALIYLSRALPALPLLVPTAERLRRPSPPCTLGAGLTPNRPPSFQPGPPPLGTVSAIPSGAGAPPPEISLKVHPPPGGVDFTKALLAALVGQE